MSALLFQRQGQTELFDTSKAPASFHSSPLAYDMASLENGGRWKDPRWAELTLTTWLRQVLS